MKTTISFNIKKEEVEKTRKLARARGFSTTSDYLRFLLAQDDISLISEDELVRRAKDVDRLYKQKKLIRAKSMAEFLD